MTPASALSTSSRTRLVIPGSCRRVWPTAKLALMSLALTSHTLLSCSWQRFDDVTRNTPVAVPESPGNVSSLGTSVAAIQGENSSLVFAAGNDGYGVYDFGRHNAPQLEAIYQGRCSASDGCHISPSVAPVHRDIDGKTVACFAYALEIGANKANARLSCEGDLRVTLALDTTTQDRLNNSLKATDLAARFASAPRKNPRQLLASSKPSATVWFYPETSSASVPILSSIEVGDSFGASLAVLPSRVDSAERGSTLVVGEPKAHRIHFFVTDNLGTVVSQYCVDGPNAFGQRLTAGSFGNAAALSLAVASATQVSVLTDLGQLAQLSAGVSVSSAQDCISVDAMTSAGSLDCKQLGLQADCESALTLLSLAPADLNQDGVDELLVGVALADAFGQSTAGQVLTVSVTPSGLRIHDHLAVASAESGDRLGESVTAVPLSRPDVVLAGAPGGNKIAAFYCSTLVPDGLGGKRCE